MKRMTSGDLFVHIRSGADAYLRGRPLFSGTINGAQPAAGWKTPGDIAEHISNTTVAQRLARDVDYGYWIWLWAWKPGMPFYDGRSTLQPPLGALGFEYYALGRKGDDWYPNGLPRRR
ncbi:hypothetical protein [Kitasatospora griseola]|uniref:hypothetical protein n=1 Tax=Kitasatospora griseola TaxID=2064 RepID=UPI003826B150